MDNKATTKRMIGAVVLVLVAALLLAWLLKGKNREGQDMAMQQTADTKPILGFPGAVDGTQKPLLVGEDPNAAQTAQQTLDPAAAATAATAAVTGIIPNVNVEPNTTGFDVRPAASGETRPVVDIDGKVKDGTGSLGTGNAAPAAAGSTESASTTTTAATTTKTDTATKAPSTNASVKDTPVEAPAEKKPATPKPVLVNEKHVPAPVSAESKAKEDAAKKAKADAEKAAAAKSLELAKGTGTAAVTTPAKPAAATTGGAFAVQLLATSDKAKADALAKTFAGEGYKTSVNAVKVDGKTVYRVVAGGYADKVAASAAQAKMKTRYSQNRDVQNSFVTSSK